MTTRRKNIFDPPQEKIFMTHAFLSQLENDGRIKCVFSTRRQFCGEKFSWIKSVFFMHQRHVTTSAYWIKRWTPV